jgi:DNA-directed RNA polymerase subunit L/DNA-directed RNA polymerase alpha subunit
MATSFPLEFTNISNVDSLTMKFRLAPTHVTYANTLRRLIMTAVETVGFRADMTAEGTTTDVTIIKNDTPMTNEMLAHRIGLIPLDIKEPLKWNKEEYLFKLSKEGETDHSVDVTTADFKVFQNTKVGEDTIEPREVATNQFFKPDPISGDYILISRLQPSGAETKQRIEIVAKASTGVGRENARFIPTSQCSYEYTRDTDESRILANFERWLMVAKKIAPGSIDKSGEQYRAYEREFQTMEINRTFLQDAVGEPYSFDFTIETCGVLDIPYIVRRACEVGETMCAKYENIATAGKDLPDDLTVSPTPSEGDNSARMLSFDFLFRNQDHTLGNLLQTYIEQNMMGDIVTFVGYKVPHPLRDEMLLRIAVKDNDIKTAIQCIGNACRGCTGLFLRMKEAWNRATVGSSTATPTSKIRLTKKTAASILPPV